MDDGKQRRLEAAGFRVGSTAEFLGLSDAEDALVELKLDLAARLRSSRTEKRLSQAALARRLRSSQSRIAKMEAGDPGVSFDLLLRALFALGATRESLARVIAPSLSLPPSGGDTDTPEPERLAPAGRS